MDKNEKKKLFRKVSIYIFTLGIDGQDQKKACRAPSPANHMEQRQAWDPVDLKKNIVGKLRFVKVKMHAYL
jgi:hypothetical protein